MIGVYAGTNIACMANVMAFRDGPLEDVERHPVNSPVLASIAHVTVAIAVFESLEDPAAIVIDNDSCLKSLLVLLIRYIRMPLGPDPQEMGFHPLAILRTERLANTGFWNSSWHS